MNTTAKSTNPGPAAPTTPAATPVPYNRGRKQRLSPEQVKANKEMAKTLIGYDSTSPIWGKKIVPNLVDEIDAAIDAGDLVKVKTITAELRRREAQKALTYGR